METEFTRTITKKSNNLVYACYGLSSISQDILQCVISQIKDEDRELNFYRFSIRDLENTLTIGSGYERRIREKNLIKARKELMSTQINFKDDSGTVDSYSWCSRFSYNMSEKWIEIELHYELNRYLIDLVNKGNFTLIENKYFLPLKSSYSKRLYMILRNKLDIAASTNKTAGHYKTSIDNLSNTLVVPESITKNFAYYNRNILQVALEQINEHTDIEIKIHTEKKGRKVSIITFLVKDNLANLEKEDILEAEYEVIEPKKISKKED